VRIGVRACRLLVVIATRIITSANGPPPRRPGAVVLVAFAVGCGGPSATNAGPEARADAMATGIATSGSSGSSTTTGATSGSTDGGSQSVSGAAASGTVGDAAAPESDAATACEHYVQAFCTRELQCNILNSASLSSCMQFAELCPDYLFSSGSTRTPLQAEGCAADVLAQSCDDLSLAANLACETPGARQVGQPCNYDSQCETLACSVGQPGGCGLCTAALGPTDDCVSAQGRCPLDDVCDLLGTRHCVAVALAAHGPGQGASCGPSNLCADPFVCYVAGADAQAGSCQPSPADGTPCMRLILSNGVAACYPFDTCQDIGGQQCVARVPLGQPCNVVPNGDPCIIGGYCDILDAGTAGICQSNRAAGQPCAVEILPGGDRSLGGCMSGICAGDTCAPVPPAPLGINDPCDADAGPCVFGLSCKNGRCQASVCEVPSADAGAD
jgi:hypothetical protein